MTVCAAHIDEELCKYFWFFFNHDNVKLVVNLSFDGVIKTPSFDGVESTALC